MSARFSPQLDPAAVLGVAPGASLEQIREAYRAKAKKYHPDAGGDEWAFQILAKAYELLSVARVVLASTMEENAPRHQPQPESQPHPQKRPKPQPFVQQPFSTPPPKPGSKATVDRTETLRQGVREPSIHPTQVVEVETMSVRYEADHVWLLTDHSSDQRLLSCSMNISWPESSFTETPASIPDAEVILKSLSEVFNTVSRKTKPSATRSSVVEGRFTGWLSFPSHELAQKAFNQLRETLHIAGLVVNQKTRDLIIPRQWK